MTLRSYISGTTIICVLHCAYNTHRQLTQRDINTGTSPHASANTHDALRVQPGGKLRGPLPLWVGVCDLGSMLLLIFRGGT
jgi:hypothetical protein